MEIQVPQRQEVVVESIKKSRIGTNEVILIVNTQLKSDSGEWCTVKKQQFTFSEGGKLTISGVNAIFKLEE